MKIKIIPLFLIVFMFFGCSTIKRQIEIAKQREVKFKVDLKSQKVPVGTVEAQLDRTFLGLKKVPVKVTYSPIEDAMCLEFRRSTIINYQFFNKSNRNAFLKALEKYIGDYEAKGLVDNKKITRKQYGSDEGYLIWRITKVSEQYHANMDFSFGYLFRGKSPFFAITQGEAVYEDIFANTKADRYSTNGEFPLLFTRAQAMELAAYFDPQFIRSLTNTQGLLNDSNINYESY